MIQVIPEGGTIPLNVPHEIANELNLQHGQTITTEQAILITLMEIEEAELGIKKLQNLSPQTEL